MTLRFGITSLDSTITRLICPTCGTRYAVGSSKCGIDGSQLRLMGKGHEENRDPLVGKKIGKRYMVQSCIGDGAVGTIYRAMDDLTEKIVAVKVLKRHHVTDVELSKRFEQEGAAAKALKHKNLIAVREYGITENNEPFIVMEFLDGDSLAEVLGDVTYLSVPRFLKIMIQVCEAMSYAHSEGVIHRDIKPANIMLVKSEREKDFVKIVDFGLAKILDHAGVVASYKTVSGDVIGTPLYMSPEQTRGSSLDSRTDIYALGCVMYECLTGIPPFIGEGILEILQKQVSDNPRTLQEIRPDLNLPVRLNEIIMKCLQKDPVMRYQSMLDLCDDLRAIQLEAPRSKSVMDRIINIFNNRSKTPGNS